MSKVLKISRSTKKNLQNLKLLYGSYVKKFLKY